MRQFGLIGYPLVHSFSENYFLEKFRNEYINDATYKNYPIKSIDQLLDLINEIPNLLGLNVTIPYKKEVIRYLDLIDKEALEVGAVNVIKIVRRNDKILLKGFNSDIYGFKESLKPLIDSHVRQAIVLGTGGGSSAVAYVLSSMRIPVIFVSRSNKENCITYNDITEELVSLSHLIVNATPLGMFPETDQKPEIPYHALTSDHILYDLIYNPSETLFLKEGEKRGCRTINGLEMLKLQAEKSWQIWNDPSV
ncbi:MAG: shikimate dehydrogenase [Bacteroidales bacterium]|nr:shikimate dehydrogenase [Bacteroidales bacterium]